MLLFFYTMCSLLAALNSRALMSLLFMWAFARKHTPDCVMDIWSLFLVLLLGFFHFFPCAVRSKLLSNFVTEPDAAVLIRSSGGPASRSAVFVYFHKRRVKYAKARDSLRRPHMYVCLQVWEWAHECVRSHKLVLTACSHGALKMTVSQSSSHRTQRNTARRLEDQYTVLQVVVLVLFFYLLLF